MKIVSNKEWVDWMKDTGVISQEVEYEYMSFASGGNGELMEEEYKKLAVDLKNYYRDKE